MISVIIDTTETFKELLLTGVAWAKLELLIEKKIVRLVVPKVVENETIGHFREQVADSFSEAKRVSGRLRKLLRSEEIAHVGDIDIDRSLSEYQSYLDHRLNHLCDERPDNSSINVDEIVQRCQQKRRPFDSNGRGLVDAIIWELTLQTAVATRQPVALITANKNDFGEPGTLAKDLEDDLHKHGLSRDAVRICRDLNDFFAHFGLPNLSIDSEVRGQIERGEFPNFDIDAFFVDAYDTIAEAVAEATKRWNFTELGYQNRQYFENPILLRLNNAPNEISLGKVFRFDEGELSFDVSFGIEGEIACDQIEYYSDEIPPQAFDFAGRVTFRVLNSLIIEESTGQVLQHDIDSIKIEPSFGWPIDEIDD